MLSVSGTVLLCIRVCKCSKRSVPSRCRLHDCVQHIQGSSFVVKRRWRQDVFPHVVQAFQHDAFFVFLRKEMAGQQVSEYANAAARSAKNGDFFATDNFSAAAWCFHVPEQLSLESQHEPVFPQMEELFHALQTDFYKVISKSHLSHQLSLHKQKLLSMSEHWLCWQAAKGIICKIKCKLPTVSI